MRYVRNCWYVAAWDSDLPADSPLAVTILDDAIVLWRDGSGEVVALEDRCVHRHAPLSLGRCESGALRCMYHGLLFDAAGVVIEIPGQPTIPPQARVRRYPVVVRHSWIWVWLGDAAAADVHLIPPAVGYDDGRFILGHGQLDYTAPARLINDNLLDFSHLSYVHAVSFQAGPAFAERLPTITPLPRGVRISRWNEQQPAQHNRADPARFDNFMVYDFLLPGVLLMQSASFAPGTASRLEYGTPDFDESVTGRNFTSQAVTPTSESTARYFFNWGPHRDQGDAAMRDGMMQVAAMAFGEDKVMIEAQAKVIARDPAHPIMPTAHDKAVTLFNRLVERLCAEEAKA